jgi:hypothetical protein
MSSATIVAADSRSAKYSLRSLLFDTAAAELGRSTAQSIIVCQLQISHLFTRIR